MAFFAASPGGSCRITSKVASDAVSAKPRQAVSGKCSTEEARQDGPGAAPRSGGSFNREARLSGMESEAEEGGRICAKTEDDKAAVIQRQQIQERRRKSRSGTQDGIAANLNGGTVAGDKGARSADLFAASPGTKLSGRAMDCATTERKYASNSTREQKMFYGAFLLLGSTIALSQVVALPVLLQMLCYTAPILYIGSHASLRQNEVDACTGERPNRTESMNHTDALLFPIFGSIALVTLYVAYKFMNASWVNFLLTLYLTAIGFFALGETIYVVLHPFVPAWMNDERRVVFRVPLLRIPLLCSAPAATISTAGSAGAADEEKAATKNNSYTCTRSYAQLLSYSIAAALSFVWLWTKHWVVHNLLAIAFCIQAIGIVSVGNFTVAAILLSGLFVYDIFWVFGTDVMVTVAKSFEGPAKLIFPVQLDPWQQSILGLGDIVVPGVLISMCLRFDYWLHSLRNVLYRSNNSSKRNSVTEEGVSATGEGDAATETTTGGSVLTHRIKGKAANAGQAEEETFSQTSQPHDNGACDSSVSSSNSLSSLLPFAQAGNIVHHRFNKFYFWVVLIFYECGLITTGVVMLLFQIQLVHNFVKKFYVAKTEANVLRMLIVQPYPRMCLWVLLMLLALGLVLMLLRKEDAALNGQVKEVLAYSEEEESASAAVATAGTSGIGEEVAAASITAAGGEDDKEQKEGGTEKRKKH